MSYLISHSLISASTLLCAIRKCPIPSKTRRKLLYTEWASFLSGAFHSLFSKMIVSWPYHSHNPVSMNRLYAPFLTGILLLVIACQPSESDTTETITADPDVIKTIGEVERLDDEINYLIPEGAEIEVLTEGHDWTEGPLWVEEGEYLLYSDIPPNSVFKWKAGEGKSLYLKPAGFTEAIEREGEPGSNGLLLDADGNLVLCQHGDRRMARMDAPLNEPVSTFTTLAGTWEGKRFNSPNDAVFHSNGDLYFTDPPYGLEKNVDDPLKEIPFQGVYRLDSEGTTHLLFQHLTRPNGIAFSPDEKTLYVANSDPELAIWMAFDVQADGSLANERVFFDATAMRSAENKGLPDGMKIDSDGYIFATGPGGVYVFSPDRRHLGTIRTGEATSNCAIGNKGKYLYMTADMYLARIKLK